MADGAATAAETLQPHNIEAEQAVLGALLIKNEVFDTVTAVVKADDFYDPVHRRIFEAVGTLIGKRSLASPITVKTCMDDDSGLRELGGGTYLVRLAETVASIVAVREYAQVVRELSLRRQLVTIGDEIRQNACRFDPDLGPPEQITKAEARLFELAETGRYDKGFRTFAEAAAGAARIAEAAHQSPGGLSGLSTGIDALDNSLWGLRKSDLLILAGRPSMGKTALATNIAFNLARRYLSEEKEGVDPAARQGGRVGFFSLEMSAEQLANRILISEAQLSAKALAQGNLTEGEFMRYLRTAREIESIPLVIDDTPAVPIAQLAARARRQKRKGLDVLIVDYLQLVRSSRTSSSRNRVEELSEVTQGLKAIAKELDIPVIALSQLSRQVEAREDKRPQLSDLRESGSIEQDADVVMFVYREEYYKEREKPADPNDTMPPEMRAAAQTKLDSWMNEMNALAGKAEVIIGKQRHGPICTVQLGFEGRYTRFSDLDAPQGAIGNPGDFA